MQREDVLETMKTYLPLLDRFQDRDLAIKVANVWYYLWKNSRWEKVAEATWNPLCPGVKLVDHTNAVAKVALEFAKVRDKVYGETLDVDILLAGALLHDASKLLEMEPDGRDGVKSKRGNLFQHAFLGAHRALVENLPDEVVHIILSHTGESRVLPKTPEAIIIYAIDLADADISRLKARAPLLMEKHKKS